jgi:hypothetical protein
MTATVLYEHYMLVYEPEIIDLEIGFGPITA